jgi:UDP-glucose 4-epimerase
MKKGREVLVYDAMQTGHRQACERIGARLIEGDIRDREMLYTVLKENRIEYVIHFAAAALVGESMRDPLKYYDNNVYGTACLLDAMVRAGVQKIVFSSSAAVYGEPRRTPILEEDEKHPTNPISPYADSKLLGEHYTLGFHQNKLLKTAALRFFNVYGPRQGLNDYSGVITKFIDRIKQNQPLTIYGDGTQTRDFIHISNIIDAIVACLENPAAEGQLFNIGTGKALTIEDLAKSLIQLSKSSSTINHAPAREGDIKHSYANITKATSLLNYQPTMQLSTGLHELLKASNALPKQSQ